MCFAEKTDIFIILHKNKKYHVENLTYWWN